MKKTVLASILLLVLLGCTSSNLTGGATTQCPTLFDLLGAIDDWQQGQLSLPGLIQVIRAWLAGCPPAPPPNIVLIVLDDVGYEVLSSYGSTYFNTPNMDRLATEGMRFTQFYTSTVCSPTRTSIITGQYPARQGIRHICGIDYAHDQKGVPGDAPALARLLGDANYGTGHIGKWHIGHVRNEFLPPNKGFDESIRSAGPYSATKMTNGQGILTIASTHITEVHTDQAIDFITRRKPTTGSDPPFFLNLWYHAPHTPLDVGNLPLQPSGQPYPAGTTEKEAKKILLENVDKQIGRILDFLDQEGLTDSTLILLMGDNGDYPVRSNASFVASRPNMNDPSTYIANGALRGRKGVLYEGGIRTPLLARWPSHIAPGLVSGDYITVLDIFPTLVSAANAVSSGVTLDGQDVLGVMTGTGTVQPPATIVWELKAGQARYATRQGDWKLISQGTFPDILNTVELFDLSSDIGEQNNLAGAYPGVVTQLTDTLSAWRIDTGTTPFNIEPLIGSVAQTGDTFSFTRGTVRLEDNTRLDVNTDDLTFMAWIRFPPAAANGSVRTIAHKPGSWYLRMSPQQQVMLTLFEHGTGTQLAAAAPTPLQPDTWYHVGFTLYNDHKVNGTNSLYVEGPGVSHIVRDDRIQEVATSTDKVFVGSLWTTGEHYLGDISQVKFYHVALTPSEFASQRGSQS